MERHLTQRKEQGPSSKVMHCVMHGICSAMHPVRCLPDCQIGRCGLSLQDSAAVNCCSCFMAATLGPRSAPPSRQWRLRASASSGNLSVSAMTCRPDTLQHRCPAQLVSQRRTWGSTATILLPRGRVSARTAASHPRQSQQPRARMAACIPRMSRSSNTAGSGSQWRLQWSQIQVRRLVSQRSVPVNKDERLFSLQPAASEL